MSIFNNVITNRLTQGYRTVEFPSDKINLPKAYRGRPVLNQDASDEDVQKVASLCPAGAVNPEDRTLDLGKCLFCGKCQTIKQDFIKFTRDYRMFALKREDLIIKDILKEPKMDNSKIKKIKKLFGKSVYLRYVCAGGCNACDADVNVLNTPVYDLSRFGIKFAASPRHADGLVVTGPITKNMELALMKTYNAIPSPKCVIAVGACAISGGLFRENEEVVGGVDKILPVDLYIPGCPPHPFTNLYAFVKFFK
ncbi:NADH-quinone oxidoreductase subunit NuoB [Methanothermococcus okinawensis]|uniref:NADH ubiquinone oxidoreductase 20 kDa subunit n=1 Tax=Methanothermococcus okinawensis (strain DSM 14208 / JCM 11175 / IH1) TaxID=647113 RepID=F8AKD1_METOI|nr:NADH-quinone oxidoreductase subunit NuoB [Methanothermococcus okinawensis]AEH06331.1 NADH ubiquinone oxidoreductase 20 kDa subunit [Methanothermococcus okinawensis IH1]